MFAFERFNKRIKSLCRNRYFALESLSNSCVLDIATRFETFRRRKSVFEVDDDKKESVLKGSPTYYS